MGVSTKCSNGGVGDKYDLHTDLGGFALCGTVDGSLRAPKNDYYDECRWCREVKEEKLQLVSKIDLEFDPALHLRQWVVMNTEQVIESISKIENQLVIIHRKKKYE